MKNNLILRELLTIISYPFRYFALAIALAMVFCLASPDCLARSIQNGAFQSFHQQAWREDREGRRFSEWKKFLNQYELIGMSKADLESLLGPAHFNSGSQPKVLDMAAARTGITDDLAPLWLQLLFLTFRIELDSVGCNESS